MKPKITLIISFFISLITNGQTPINSFVGVTGEAFDIITANPDLDQTAAGPNITWNFNQLVLAGQSTSTILAPTAAQLTTFPTTTNVKKFTNLISATTTFSELFYKNVSSEISLTGVTSDNLILNYVTNNAKLGTFPLIYGYNFTDTTAGTFTSGTNNGTFTGNIVTSVDAYGTLTLNNTGNGSFSGPVTRLKTVQNITLFQGFFNVGSAVQTSYSYYSGSNLNPELRYTKAVINIPLLNITNQTAIQIEDFATILLSTNNNILTDNISIYPNPVNDILNIKSKDNQKISFVITDINGREIISKTSNDNNINVSNLKKGIYFVKITNDNSSITKKIIKN